MQIEAGEYIIVFGRWIGQHAAVYSDSNTILRYHKYDLHPVIRHKIGDAIMAHPFDMAAAEDYFFDNLR